MSWDISPKSWPIDEIFGGYTLSTIKFFFHNVLKECTLFGAGLRFYYYRATGLLFNGGIKWHFC